MNRFVVIASALLAIVSASSCNSFRVADSETLMRYVAEDDSLLVLELERGIMIESGKDGLGRASEALRLLAGGRRIVPASGTWINVDFDDQRPKADVEEKEARNRAELLEVAGSVRVEEQGLYLEQDGRLSFYRLMRLGHVQRALEVVNAIYNRDTLANEKPDRVFTPGFPYFDAEADEIYHAALKRNHRWLGIEGGAIVLDLPMTSANAARCAAWLAGEGRKPAEGEFSGQLLGQASGLEIEGGRARLSFGGPKSPVIRFAEHAEHDPEAATALLESLRASGVKFGAADAPAKAVQKFDPTGAAQIRWR